MKPPTRVKLGEVLCPLDELEDPGTRAFRVVFDDKHELDIFVVRRGMEAFAYVNNCPHQFLPLNWNSEIFLNLDKTHILCMMHAARFEIDTGKMIYGPITADCRLRPVPIIITNGNVRLGKEEIPRF